MTDPKTSSKAALWRLVSLGVILVFMVMVGACDRVGPAPEDLDYTPTPLPPTAVPTATPDSGEPQEVSEQQLILDAILTAIPDRLPAGAIQWQRDNDRGVETPPRVENGIGFKVYYTESVGGQANITYIAFDTPEDATAHFEFIGGLRDVLQRLGTPNDTFPSPNLFGSGTYGSNAIFIVNEVYFIEVSIPQFSSTVGNPLVPLSREAITILEAGLLRYNNPDVKPQRLEAILAVLPDQILAEDTIWQRRLTRDPEIIDDIDNGLGARVLYNEENGGEATVAYFVFDTSEDMLAHYEAQRHLRRSREFQLNLSEGLEDEDLPSPNLIIADTLHGEVAILQFGEIYIIDIEVFTSEADGLLVPLAGGTVSILEEAIALYDASAGESE